MRCSIQQGLSRDWCRALGVSDAFQSYLRSQLCRRGLRHPERLAEGLDLAVHLFAADRWMCLAAPPTDPRGWRAMLDRAVHQALRVKAAAADRSISDVVNEAVRLALAEDAQDLAAFEDRKGEGSAAFECFVRALRHRPKKLFAVRGAMRPGENSSWREKDARRARLKAGNRARREVTDVDHAHGHDRRPSQSPATHHSATGGRAAARQSARGWMCSR